MIKKFYNTDLPDTGGATPSVAEMMAKHGVINNTDVPVATPVPDKEVVEETPQAPPKLLPLRQRQKLQKAKRFLKLPRQHRQKPLKPKSYNQIGRKFLEISNPMTY